MIIESLSGRIADGIKQADPDGETSREVMVYALNFIFNFSFALAISAAVGSIVGHLSETMLAFAAFAALRFFSAGFHLRSLDACAMISALIFVAIPFVQITPLFAIIATSIALLIAIKWAPNVMEETTRDPKTYPMMKWISLLLIASNLILQSQIIALAFLAQAILIIPWEEVSKYASRTRS